MPEHYACGLDHRGERLDKDDRPELKYGTYEFVAQPKISNKRQPVQPSYVFMLDCSILAFQTGFLHQSLSSIKQCLDSLQQQEITSVCVATYDSAIQFYHMPQDANGEP